MSLIDFNKYINESMLKGIPIIKDTIINKNKDFNELTYWYEPRYISYCLSDLSYKLLLLENTGVTVEPNNVVKYLKFKLCLKDWLFKVSLSRNDVMSIDATYENYDIISISIPDLKNNKEIITNILNHFGYYLGSYYESELKDWITMSFHPAYLNSIKNKIKEKYNFLYHITDIKNKDKILNNGFITKSSDGFFKYPPRCHFFLEKNDAISFMNSLHYDYNINKFVLFTLNLDNLNNELYPDPNIHDAVITKDNVSPETIINYEILTFNDKSNR